MKYGLLLILAAVAVPAWADLPGKSGVTVTAGTLGIGIEVARSLPGVNLTGRLAWNGYTYGYDANVDGIEYAGDLELSSVTALVDWRPWGKLTHLTAGVVLNNNAVTASSVPASSYVIGNASFTADQVGTLRGDVGFDRLSPYVGFGWNVPVAPKTALSLEFGAVLQGSPKVDLSADGTLANDPLFQAQLEYERQRFEYDVRDFEIYPVVALGIQRRF